MTDTTVTLHDTPRVRIALCEAGAGRPLVFLHGLGGSSKSWARQLENLSARRHVIAWDCPGYGDSADFPGGHPTCHDFAKALLAALDAAEIGDFDLVGHSMGGAVAPWVARLAPLRVGKLVLSATKVAFGKDNPLGYDKRLAERRQMDDQTFGKARAQGMVGEDSPVFEEIASIAGEIRLSGYEGAVSLLKTADNSAILPTVDQPTLVIAGANDGIAPAEATQAVADAVPGARLETIPDSAHAAYMQQPERYNAVLNAFLADN
ncbi:MAG: alpha/beta fold hydrolase [Alphaproteobacteria bacterium]